MRGRADTWVCPYDGNAVSEIATRNSTQSYTLYVHPALGLYVHTESANIPQTGRSQRCDVPPEETVRAGTPLSTSPPHGRWHIQQPLLTVLKGRGKLHGARTDSRTDDSCAARARPGANRAGLRLGRLADRTRLCPVGGTRRPDRRVPGIRRPWLPPGWLPGPDHR